jgi:electron transfer flavoprotein alpha subunit
MTDNQGQPRQSRQKVQNWRRRMSFDKPAAERNSTEARRKLPASVNQRSQRMRIVVCIKQVPILAALEFDPLTKSLKREGIRSEVSSFDVRALLKAVDLKDRHGGDVLVLTMGPPQAREALLECLALGADRGLHLCDPGLAGSDTLATARALAAALRRCSFDLILCGRASVDAETAQVGPEVAELLGLPQVTAAHSLIVDNGAVVAESETDDGYEIVCVQLPALVTAAEDLAPERFATKDDRQNAINKPIETVGIGDLDIDPGEVGTNGSPTWVSGLQSVETRRRSLILAGDSPEESAEKLAKVLIDDHGLWSDWNVQEQPAIATIAHAPRRVTSADICVLAEEREGTIRRVVLELLSKAIELSKVLQGKVTAVLIGRDITHHQTLLAEHGADRILVCDDPVLAPFDAEVHAELLVRLLRQWNPGVFLIPATGRGRSVAPRVAARLSLGLTGDCIDLGLDAEGRLVQYKPAFGGSVVAPILSRTLPEMATVRPGVLTMAAALVGRRAEIVDVRVGELPARRSIVQAMRRTLVAGKDLDDADIVIGLGRGFGSSEQLRTVQPLVDLLDAATCTTRDVTDAGWLPRQYQVGLTGRSISPKLYLAIAIRGAFEHLVGVRRAGLIVAINKNAKAPVFKNADYGIVGNYAEIVPALHRHLERLRPRG